SIQTEMLVFPTAEEVDQSAHDGKDRRLFAPLFFRETTRRLCDKPVQCMSANFGCDAGRNAADDFGNDPQQRTSALVQSEDMELSSASLQRQRWNNETNVPARIPSWILVARRQQDAASLIQRCNERPDCTLEGNLLNSPMDLNPKLCSVGLTWKEHCFADHRNSSK